MTREIRLTELQLMCRLFRDFSFYSDAKEKIRADREEAKCGKRKETLGRIAISLD